MNHCVSIQVGFLCSLAALGAHGCIFSSAAGSASSASGGGSGSSAAATQERSLEASAAGVAPIAGVAGGERDLRAMNSACRGYASQAPTAILRVGAPIAAARIFVQSSQDTTLAVQHPDGSFSCDDDGGGSNNPLVSTSLAPGEHRVWVGTFRSNATAEFSMTVSEPTAAERATGSGGYVGEVTLENRSGVEICRVEHDGGPSSRETVDQPLRVANGASATFRIESTLSRIWILDCAGGVVFGRPNPSLTESSSAHIGTLRAPTITVLASGSAPVALSAERHTLIAEPMSLADYLRGTVAALAPRSSDEMNADRALRAQAFEALRVGGAERRYIETFLSLRLTSNEWAILRHRRTGIVTGRALNGVALARFPDGHCQATPVSFSQQHDGSSFSGSLRFMGIGGNHYLPCAIAEGSTRDPAWAH